jgi:hypothetical protein
MHVRIANAQAAQLAAGGRAADFGKAIDQILGWALNILCFDHRGCCSTL